MGIAVDFGCNTQQGHRSMRKPNQRSFVLSSPPSELIFHFCTVRAVSLLWVSLAAAMGTLTTV